ncbi:hypothetical protein SAMN05518672_102314 [Chitinophaga sp. CF118]|uniref:hypothetical protein n=1 Tax=Chitinophaga sp. CF118 TaxID=1884367 RepID=UPI0008F4543C|nr:hypothetical protein [Chitinophaga sp. CF118]SFD52966.1 hypothetical protein SAMN05518672_102314 [Chitinophaga sp. CF118]
MCYLLIGNISALISDDCIEPLVNARLRVYLPEGSYPKACPKRNIFNGPEQLSPAQVAAKSDRLLAETTLDERGNFTLNWEQLHLFTEPLELDICLNRMPEQASGKNIESHYHLSTLVPHWKRSLQRYVAAFAYVIPAENWSQIRASYGTWVIAGTIRRIHSREGQSQLRVEVYNAVNNRLLACTSTDEKGRYQLRFGRRELTSGKLMLIRDYRHNNAPDVYFKVYRDNRLLWEEEADVANMPGRKAIASCSVINIHMQQVPVVKKPAGYVSGLLSNWAVVGRKSSLVNY